MKFPLPIQFSRAALPLLLCAAALTFNACTRAPRTSAELHDQLPRRFTGELHWRGEPQGQRIRIDARQLSERDAHVLEFKGVHVALLDEGGAVVSERDVATHGTISAPELEIRIEDLGAPEGAEDFLKPGSFIGKLSKDLQGIEAGWTDGLGGKGRLELKADAAK